MNSAAYEALYSKTFKYLGPPAPQCPKCGKRLDSIEVIRYPDRLMWDEEKRKYAFSKLIPAATYTCPNCHEVIGGRYGTGDKWGFQPRDTPITK